MVFTCSYVKWYVNDMVGSGEDLRIKAKKSKFGYSRHKKTLRVSKNK